MDASHFDFNKVPLYEQVADRLESLILGDYSSGERLPSEQALAEQTGVSRTIIRESLKLLKERGLIDSKTGSGAFVTKPEAQNVSNVMARIIQIEHISADSIYEVREILECAAVRRAVRFATAEDFSLMRETLDTLRSRDLEPETRRDLDFHFHYLIAKSSCNPMLAILVQSMSNLYKDVIRTGIFIQGGIDDGIMRHDRIMAALEKRDEELATRMVHEHLAQSLDNYHEYQSGKHSDRA